MTITSRKATHYALAAGLVALAWIIRLPIAEYLQDWVPHSPFFPAVAFAAVYGGLDVGIFAAILASLSMPWWPNLPNLPANEGLGPVDITLFVVINILILALCEGMTRARRTAERLAEERRLHLETERQLRAQAEQANLLKDEFLASVSHELRSPLQPILGWSELLLQQADSEETKAGLSTIVRSAEMQSHLIEDLLDMSRVVTGHMRLESKPVELADVVHEAVETVSIAARAKNIHIESHIAVDGVAIVADHARLVQVVWNLLSNAVKFTPSGGHIDVSVKQNHDLAEIVVTDTGQGIAPDFQPLVFDRFQKGEQTGKRKGGLGLGLAIVKNIVELHGGTVTVSSPGEGLGTTFTVRLPIQRPAQPQDARELARATA